MSDEEEKKSLLPVQQESSYAYGSVVAQPEDGDQEGRQGDEERLLDDSEEADAQQCWVSRNKILTAGVIFTAWICIGITIFLVLFLKVITLANLVRHNLTHNLTYLTTSPYQTKLHLSDFFIPLSDSINLCLCLIPSIYYFVGIH